MIRPGVATAREAVINDVLGEVTHQGLQGQPTRFPVSPFGSQQGRGLHMGLNVHIIVPGKKLIQSDLVPILEVHLIDLIPHPRFHHLRTGDLPTPEVIEEIAAHGAGTGVIVVHQWLNPLGVEITGLEFHQQCPLQAFHFRCLRIRVLQHPVAWSLTLDVLHRIGKAALVVKTIVIIEQAVQVTGPAQIGPVYPGQDAIKGLVFGLPATSHPVGMPHATTIGPTQFVPALPGAGAGCQPVNTSTVGAGRRTEHPQGCLPARITR